MNPMQNAKYVPAIKPAAIVDNATATATEIDTRGYDYCTIVCQLGATDIAMTALKVQAATASGGSFADITGATFDAGTSADGVALALPSATDDGQTAVFQVDMRGKEPFLKLVASFGDGVAGGYVAASAVLTRGEVSPTVGTSMADGGVCRV